MQTAYLNSPDFSFFSDAKIQLDFIINHLSSSDCNDSEHGEVEKFICQQGNELLRCLLQGFFDQKAANEVALNSVASHHEGVLSHVRHSTSRQINSLFGEVIVCRKSYGHRNKKSQFPLDAELNLPKDKYSDGLRHRVAKEVIRGSFDNTVEAIDTTTGGHVPKRQCLGLTQDVAQDFEAFYQKNRYQQKEETADLLVLSFDGKGIVMRHNSLRECTKKAAKRNKKLESRLSPGEKKNRKRMAQVATVYTVKPHIRSAESIMKRRDGDETVKQFRAPARKKRVWASVEREAEAVIEEGFQEALQRDPEQKRPWVVLIDGHPHQISQIKRVMKRLKIEATIVMDFIHVLEYLWKAAWCFFDAGDDQVESWVADRALKILEGKSNQVAKGIRISATKRALTDRTGVDKCAVYLLKNQTRLDYASALSEGFPIASGVIEGACRHLINDRLDITGARWELEGAEAILKLRSLKSSGDFDAYWEFHKQKSKQRLYGDLQIDGEII